MLCVVNLTLKILQAIKSARPYLIMHAASTCEVDNDKIDRYRRAKVEPAPAHKTVISYINIFTARSLTIM